MYFDVPALVDENLRQHANELLTVRGRGRGKQGKRINALLRGRMYCPECQQPMVVRRHTRDQERIYYYCRRHGEAWRERLCSYRSFVPASWDQIVWADLCSLLRNDRWLDAEIGEAKRTDEAASKLALQQEARVALVRNKRVRVQQGYEADIYTLEQAKSRINQLDAEIDRAEAEAERLRRLAGRGPISSQDLEKLKEELQTLRDRNLDKAAFDERADLIASLGVRVYPSEDLKTMRVKCRLPVDDELDEPRGRSPAPDPMSPLPSKTERESANGCDKVPSAPP